MRTASHRYALVVASLAITTASAQTPAQEEGGSTPQLAAASGNPTQCPMCEVPAEARPGRAYVGSGLSSIARVAPPACIHPR